MKIRESGENYLETILVLKKSKGNVRSIDIATELNYSKASISRAVGILQKAGLIIVGENGNIDFTKSGEIRAREILERHKILCDYLINELNVSQAVAEQDACRMEHIISRETFNAIKNYKNKVKNS